MINNGKRRYGQPLLIKDEKANHLDRVALDANEFNEQQLQKLIDTNPDILPISEIDTGFTPAISIGREVSTNVGPIDNLLVSPDGYLTIVETKLWRNPEARREVVGQILDYAKELNKWTFADLDNSVKRFNQQYEKNSEGLLATVRKHTQFDQTEETFFIDNISKNLKRGRFLLLIVGDGIRESVEDMVEYLERTPQLFFTLALVELQVYKLNQNDNSLIIVPQVVTRTKEIIRAVVRIEGEHAADVKVNIETDLGTETVKRAYKRTTITEEDFFEQLKKKTNKETVEFAHQIIEDCEKLGMEVVWNSGSFTLRLPDPEGSGEKIAIAHFMKNGSFNLGFSGPQFKKLQLSREISYRFASDTASLLPRVQPRANQKHIWQKSSTLNDLRNVYPKFLDRVKKYVNEISMEAESK